MLRGEKLGEGTFGIVYEGESPKSNRKYAVKRNLVENVTSFIGAAREVDMLNKMRNHPHIVKLEQVSFGEPFNKGCFSPLDLQQRGTQRDDDIHFVFKQAAYDLHRFIYGAVTIDFALIKRYMVHLLLGVEYIHSNKIIHRDLKPSNVLIFGEEKDSLGINNVAKICDFGLAKPFTYQGFQTPNTVTSWYRAPEITLGYPHYDYKVDIWALGCIFFEMIAKKAFIVDAPDNNDEILSRILGSLPQPLPIRKFREIIRSNKWRQVKLTKAHSPNFRHPYNKQISLTNNSIKQFEKYAGSFTQFCDLLDHMLQFDWELRYNIKDCLNHPFFKDYSFFINTTRKYYIPQCRPEIGLIVYNCIERKWVAGCATRIFNNRANLKWYNNRSLFQAMDLFDRYLSVMFISQKIPPNSLESDVKGFIHDKFNTILRFMVCLYLSIKYFSSIHYPTSFNEIVSSEYHTQDALMIAEQFESSFIKNCLEYNIYRPTIYEAADQFNDALLETNIRDLIVLYSHNHTFTGYTPTQLYSYYRSNLKDKDIRVLFDPIPKLSTDSVSLNVISKLPEHQNIKYVNNSSIKLNTCDPISNIHNKQNLIQSSK